MNKLCLCLCHAQGSAGYCPMCAGKHDDALKRELVEQLGIALETVDCLRDGFTEELSGDACVNLDKIMTIWKSLLTRAEKTL